MSVRPVVSLDLTASSYFSRLCLRLASWMGDGHTDHVQLEGFLTHAVHTLTLALSEVADPLALAGASPSVAGRRQGPRASSPAQPGHSGP